MDRRSAIKLVVGAVGTLNFENVSAGAEQHLNSIAFKVQSPQLTLNLNEHGEIDGVVFTPEHKEEATRKVSGRTVLAGCTVRHASARKLGAGAVEFTKVLTSEHEGQSCTLTERFLPGDSGSIRWEIEIMGDGQPWSTPIETHLVWPVTAETEFWTTWGDSRPEDSPGWNDPLVPVAFGERSLHYGALDTTKSQGISVPIATVLDKAVDLGLSMALSPTDGVIELDLVTTPEGELVFSRSNNRISKSSPVRFAMDLVAHPADWRAALGWMVARYPQYFNPPNPLTYEIAGNTAYSQYEGELDAYKFLAMGFRVNWKASFDWYMFGLFLPPVGDDVEFVCPRASTGTAEFPTSISHLREYSEQMRRNGFHVLNYFNSFEFGYKIVGTAPPPPRKAKNDADLWRDPNDLAHYVLQDALLRDEQGKLNITGGGQEDVLLDPGEPVYARLLLQQAKMHIEKFPASAGLCFDEMQYIRRYNPQRDDGVTWKEGHPARALVVSWQDFMSKLGPVMHDAGKVIYGNPLCRRLDVMNHLDGFYDEHGFAPYSLNSVAFMALRKPTMAWTIDIYDPDPDAYFQRHLHLGSYVTAPYPVDDHAIMPSGIQIDRYYLDYGPLFDALRARTWVLEPHAIEVDGQKAKANLFAVPGGYLISLTFGGKSDRVKVLLRGLHKLPNQEGFLIEVIHPGGTEWASLRDVAQADEMVLDVPLKRGCAMVKLSYAWIKPDRHYFVKPQTVTLGTTIRGAQLRYTLDGKEPTAASMAYTRPITIDHSTTLRLGAFRYGSLTGSILAADLVKTLPPAPWINPFRGTFEDEVTVELSQPYGLEDAEIRYTLDGCEVTGLSHIYSAPIELSTTTTLRARTFIPGKEPSIHAERQFSKLAPTPPLPHVYLSDLTPLKASLQDGKTLKKDRSFADTPLSIAGKNYQRGLGTISWSELIYELGPGYGSFVAVVGLDDAVAYRSSNYTIRSKFHVYVKNEREELLIHETPMLYPGEYWPIEVRIPLASLEIRLAVTDGINGDHSDWGNAGFLMDENNQGAELLQTIRRR